jgi:CBS domain-containing protein
MSEKKLIRPWMKTKVFSINPQASLREAAQLMVDKKIGTLPVVDEQGYLLGLTTMRALVRFFLPDFTLLMQIVDFVKDFGAIGNPSQEDIEKADAMTVGQFMSEATSVEDNCSLARALTLMFSHDVLDLPVVREGKLVGIASRVDIGRAFLDSWLGEQHKQLS